MVGSGHPHRSSSRSTTFFIKVCAAFRQLAANRFRRMNDFCGLDLSSIRPVERQLSFAKSKSIEVALYRTFQALKLA